MGKYPGIFSYLYRRLAPKQNRSLVVCGRTDIVIEGFFRSANTFAVIAFAMAQERPVEIAHHLHMASQVTDGVKRGLPVCVLIRDPIEATRSSVVRHPQLHWRYVLKEYIRFYAVTLDVADNCLIVPFGAVTSDFGLVTKLINEKFDTHFGVFAHTESNVSAVFAEIEKINARRGEVSEMQVARPSKHRSDIAVDIDVNDPIARKAVSIFLQMSERIDPRLLGASGQLQHDAGDVGGGIKQATG